MKFVSASAAVVILLTITSLAAEGLFSDNTPTMTTLGNEIVLRMELNAYASYGEVDHATDIAYQGTNHQWTFAIPAGTYSSAYFRTSLVLDDHIFTQPFSYRIAVATNGNFVFDGDGSFLEHGRPGSDPNAFANWTRKDFAITGSLGSQTTFYMANTSSSFDNNPNDWFAVDWIELHLVGVPEPGGASLGALSFLGLAFLRLRRSRQLRTIAA